MFIFFLAKQTIPHKIKNPVWYFYAAKMIEIQVKILNHWNCKFYTDLYIFFLQETVLFFLPTSKSTTDWMCSLKRRSYLSLFLCFNMKLGGYNWTSYLSYFPSVSMLDLFEGFFRVGVKFRMKKILIYFACVRGFFG